MAKEQKQTSFEAKILDSADGVYEQEQVVEWQDAYSAAEQADMPTNEHEPQTTTRDITLYIPETATTEERLSLMSYLGDTEPLWNYQGESLVIIGVVAFDDWKRDENGELLLDEEMALIPCKRTIWKGQLGKLWHSTSNVAYAFAKQKLWPIMGIGGKQGNLLAPVTIKIGSKPTRNGRRTFKFDIVGE